jgi:hypothetical protein
MCRRRFDEELCFWRQWPGGYARVLAEMLPGGHLSDPERLNRWDRLALAEEHDVCHPDEQEFLSVPRNYLTPSSRGD